MRVLVAVWDGGGTVPVEMGVVRRLRQRGHRVHVLADPTIRAAAEAVGAKYLPWRQAPARRSTDPADDVIKDWECRTPLGQFARVRDRIIIGPSAAYAADVGNALAAEDIDVLVADGALLGALAAAEAAQVPAVALCPNVYLRPAPGLPPFGLGVQPARGAPGRLRDRAVNALVSRMWRTGLPTFNATRAQLGLGALRDPFAQWDRCTAVAVLTARAFDFPAELPANVHYVGPVLDDPVWSGPEPGVPEGAPLVVVGLSSTYVAGQADLLRRIVAALDSLDVVALVTTGPTIGPAEVPGTARVRVVGAAPHQRLFPRAALVITHAGHGTVIKALAAGVPVVGMPEGRDQPDNMARVTARGAGVVLRSSARPDRIAAAVRTVLEDRGYRDRAARLGAAIRAEAAESRIQDLVETVAQVRPGSPEGIS